MIKALCSILDWPDFGISCQLSSTLKLSAREKESHEKKKSFNPRNWQGRSIFVKRKRCQVEVVTAAEEQWRILQSSHIWKFWHNENEEKLPSNFTGEECLSKWSSSLPSQHALQHFVPLCRALLSSAFDHIYNFIYMHYLCKPVAAQMFSLWISLHHFLVVKIAGGHSASCTWDITKLSISKRTENSSCSAMCVVHTVLHFWPLVILTTKMADKCSCCN